MPLTFFSHQVPVLLLKRWRPAFFSGTALALGSMAPDLEHAIQGVYYDEKFGHTPEGQFLFCLPLTLVLYVLVTRLLARPLLTHAPDCGGFHVQDYALLAEPPPGRRGWKDLWLWVRVVISALVGSFSHLWLDGFTNGNGWFVKLVPALTQYYTLFGRKLTRHLVVQYAGSVALVGVALWILWGMGTRRDVQKWRGEADPQAPRPCRESRHVFRSMLATTLVVALLGAMISAGQAEPWWTPRWAVWSIFRFTPLGLLGLCLTAAGTMSAMREPLAAAPGREAEPARPT